MEKFHDDPFNAFALCAFALLDDVALLDDEALLDDVGGAVPRAKVS
ncbi:hypothetical protein [Corynebacterium pseudopelargi]|nr:hypothetical protein [Corynebacterium pseudopelargi]